MKLKNLLPIREAKEEMTDATVCKMKLKDGRVEHIMFDDKDKKNFDAKTTKFLEIYKDAK